MRKSRIYRELDIVSFEQTIYRFGSFCQKKNATLLVDLPFSLRTVPRSACARARASFSFPVCVCVSE